MAKQLNIDLSVRADTSQAKQQFQELQHSLSNLTKSAATSNQSLGLTKELSTAISKTVELLRVVPIDVQQSIARNFIDTLRKNGIEIEE